MTLILQKYYKLYILICFLICSLFLTNLSYSALTLGEPNQRFTSQFFLEKLNLAKTYWKNKDFNNVIKILTINIENENTIKWLRERIIIIDIAKIKVDKFKVARGLDSLIISELISR